MLASRPDPTAAQVQGDPVPSGTRREVRGQVGASINNAGLQNTLDVSWTRPTSRSHHPLLAGAHIATGLTNAVTPSQAKLGGWIEYSPLSILDLRAGIDPSVYFGTFDSLMGLASYDRPPDPHSRKKLGDVKAGVAARAYLSPTLKFKAGPIVGSAGAEFEWWRSSADGDFFYEPTRDTVLKSAGDQLITTTSVLMYQWTTGPGSLSVGGLHTLADAPGNRDSPCSWRGISTIRPSRGNGPQPSPWAFERDVDDCAARDQGWVGSPIRRRFLGVMVAGMVCVLTW